MSKIQFDTIKEIPKGWGSERIIANNDKYCGKFLSYTKAGSVSSAHFHPIKSESFLVIQGTFKFSYWDSKGLKKSIEMCQGAIIHIPNCCPHQLEALEDDSIILEVSTPHSDDDVVRIEPGDSQK